MAPLVYKPCTPECKLYNHTGGSVEQVQQNKDIIHIDKGKADSNCSKIMQPHRNNIKRLLARMLIFSHYSVKELK